MKAVRLSTTFALCLLLAGCHRKVAVAPPPAPPHVAMISVPPPSHPSEPEPEIPLAEPETIDAQLPRRIGPRFRPLPATPAQLAGLNPPPPAPVDLGQLTAGGDSDTSANRQQTMDLIQAQQKRLAAIPRNTAARHGQQVQQARLFLRQADDAWNKADLEGARTLATKAKLLLDEI